jgi:hypothetical protein
MTAVVAAASDPITVGEPTAGMGSHDLHLVGEVLCVAVDFQQVVVRCLQATVEHRKHGQCCFYPVDCCAQVVDLLVHHQQLFVLHVGGHCDDEGVGWGFTAWWGSEQHE